MPRPRYDTSCKIGTVPALVRVHGSDRIEVDRLVRYQDMEGARWQAMIVRRINDDGFFFGDMWLSWAPASGPQPKAGETGYDHPAHIHDSH